MLTKVVGTWPEGLGEPLNLIISGKSAAAVLKDTETDGGLRNYFLAVGFSGECLGQHAGNGQGANLGDGLGYRNETAVIRWNYGDPQLGTCRESIEGGNHFRYWTQNGKSANSGAVFMAVSYEKPVKFNHDIVVNGYNLGRDEFVGNATGQWINGSTLTDSSTFSGSISTGGYTYETNVRYISGLLQNSSEGINHAETVGIDNKTAIDGLVALLDVQITSQPAKSRNDAALLALTSGHFFALAACAVLPFLTLI